MLDGRVLDSYSCDARASLGCGLRSWSNDEYKFINNHPFTNTPLNVNTLHALSLPPRWYIGQPTSSSLHRSNHTAFSLWFSSYSLPYSSPSLPLSLFLHSLPASELIQNFRIFSSSVIAFHTRSDGESAPSISVTHAVRTHQTFSHSQRPSTA